MSAYLRSIRLVLAISSKWNLIFFSFLFFPSFSGAELGLKIHFVRSQYPQYFMAPLLPYISPSPSLNPGWPVLL